MSVYEPNVEQLGSQINSICAQNNISWALYIRFDGTPSPDAWELVVSFANRYPAHIVVLGDNCKHYGKNASNNRLLNHVLKHDYEYFLFVEQDGLWYDSFLNHVRKRVDGNIRNTMTPHVVHFDFAYSDKNSNLLHDAFLESHKFSAPVKEDALFFGLCVQNLAPNPVLLFNRAAVNVSFPIADDAITSSWWIALCSAAARGKIEYIDEVHTIHRESEVKRDISKTINPPAELLKEQWKKFVRHSQNVETIDYHYFREVTDRLDDVMKTGSEIMRLYKYFRLGVKSAYHGKGRVELLLDLAR